MVLKKQKMWPMIFVFLSYLDRNVVEGQFLNDLLEADTESSEVFYTLNGTFCSRSTSLEGTYLHQVSDGAEEVRTLRDLVGDLLDCSVTRNQIEVNSFMHVCRLGLKHQRRKLVHSRISLLNVAEAKSQCQAFLRRSKRGKGTGSPSAGPSEGDTGRTGEESGAHRRIRRGFTYPGTLWCGAGNIADNYEHLGEFAATDGCCRVHDHCPYIIQAFSSNFGYTNFKWHSLSHCDCDNALKECLRKVNDTSSRVVGQAFFNVIEVPCFEFAHEDRCVQRHWYGLCRRYDKVPIAVLRKSIPYDFGGIDIIDTLTVAPRVQKVREGGQEDTPENATRPSASSSQTAGEEPSIGKVVTAAEDFIKVLATVSTSQSSTTEAMKKEAHGGDRKKKKKKKGKGERRKQRVSALPRPEEASAATPSGQRPEDDINDGRSRKKPRKATHLGPTLQRNVNILRESMLDLEILSNKLSNDEPQWFVRHVAPPTAAKAEPPESGHQSGSRKVFNVSLLQSEGQKPKGRQGRGKKRKRTPTSAPESSLGAETETDTRGRTCASSSSPSAEHLVPERHTDAGRLTSDSRTSTGQPQKPQRHKLRLDMGPKKKREDMPSFYLTVERPVISIPLAAARRTAPNGKLNGSTAGTRMRTIGTETGRQLELWKSEVHSERAILSTPGGLLSTWPLRSEKQKHRGDQEQKQKRRITATSPSVPAPVAGKAQAIPNPQLHQPWLTWVHRLLGSLGNVA